MFARSRQAFGNGVMHVFQILRQEMFSGERSVRAWSSAKDYDEREDPAAAGGLVTSIEDASFTIENPSILATNGTNIHSDLQSLLTT